MRNATSYSLAILSLLTTVGCSSADSTVSESGSQKASLGAAIAECDIIEQLEAQPEITLVQELTQDPTKPGYVEGTRKFLVKIRQLVDHENSGGPTFEQRFFLWHRSNMTPMVLYSGGYGLNWGDRASEVTPIVTGNQISVEYRYFGESLPVPTDYRYLTQKQSADDYHHLTTVLKRIYTGKWISTGRSKGGQTSIHYRAYYPDDVIATVPMVAANVQTELTTNRFPEWLRAVGQRFPACHQRTTAWFREVLKRRDMIGQRMAVHPRYTYNQISIQRAIEYSIKNWAYEIYIADNPAVDCPTFPDSSISDDELWKYVDEIGLTYAHSDEAIAAYDIKPYAYQLCSELGHYSVDEEPLRDLLRYPGEYSWCEFVPPGSNPVYDPTTTRQAIHWMKSEGTRMFFVYGGTDPFSATWVRYPGVEDAHVKWANDGPVTGHRAGIFALNAADRQLAANRLTAWTGSSAPLSADAWSGSPFAASDALEPPMPGAVTRRAPRASMP
ncbi:hypothetical protein LVJ94_48750 [Pendulispora rubella]|uniref:Uncharacterized protein n=1 Tax=Pendulispora rubella TaxID=2741070 RepID=A0ABZ2L1Q0_9BACT